MTFEIAATDITYQGWTRLILAQIRSSDGQLFRREIEDHGAAAAVLPYDPERKMAILVRQFRAPVFYVEGRDHTLEAIAGLIDADDPADCARREAREEAGLVVREVERVAAAWTMPGLSTERMSLFLASYCSEDRQSAGGGRPDENEDIAVIELPLPELAAMADAGRIDDLKTLTLIQTLRLRRPGLFTP